MPEYRRRKTIVDFIGTFINDERRSSGDGPAEVSLERGTPWKADHPPFFCIADLKNDPAILHGSVANKDFK